MTWDQIVTLYDIDRTPEGYAKITPPEPRQRSAYERFKRRYFLLGITDAGRVAEGWAKEKARIQAEIDRDPKRKKAQTRKERIRKAVEKKFAEQRLKHNGHSTG